jgi:hypothetical protein
MSAEIKSTSMPSVEESVKPTTTDLGAKPDQSGSSVKTSPDPVQTKRQISETTENQGINEGKKCVVM